MVMKLKKAVRVRESNEEKGANFFDSFLCFWQLEMGCLFLSLLFNW